MLRSQVMHCSLCCSSTGSLVGCSIGTVELWKRAFRSVKVRLKRIGKAGDKEVKKKAEGAGVSSTQEVVHHDQPETIDASTVSTRGSV